IVLASTGGRRVATVKAGTYRLVVRDMTSRDNFHLLGPGVNRKTGVAAKTTVTWMVRFAEGKIYRFRSDAHPSLKGSVRVLAVAKQARPRNIRLPTISGTARVGRQLTASPGSWAGSPTRYAYQWRRCDRNGNDCAFIPRATSTGYTLTSADRGLRIRVNVFATNAAGTRSQNSAATAIVQAP